jgi:hypothetical protein
MPLPPGTALNPLTGLISGVPTTPGTYTFTLRVRDAQGSLRDIPQSITIADYTPPSLTGTLAEFANRTVPYSSGFTVSGGTAPYTWSIASGTLPTGMTINASTGVISGTPSDTTYTDRNITVRVVDNAGSSAQRTQTIRYADVLALSGSLAAGVQGSAYSSGFTRTGGHSAFTFTLISGSLPSGLSLNSATGVISGTPTVTTSTAITIRVTDAAGAFADRSQTLVINSSYVPIDITGSVTNNSQNVETLSSFSITPTYSGVAVTGGSGSITYSWARISGSTAISAGAPSSLATSFVGTVAPGANVSAVFRLTATDGISSDTLDVTITVTNTYVTMALDASALPRGTRTVAYSNTLSRTGGKSPYTFALISGTLPTGITLNASTGQLSGTPTDASYTTRSLTFRVTDALGATADAIGSIIYRNFPSFSFVPAAAMRTRAYTALCEQVAGGHTPATFALISGSLPTGLSIDTFGTISGTPTSTSYGDYEIMIRMTDAAGNETERTGTIEYADNLSLSGTTTPTGDVGASYTGGINAAGGFGGNSWSISSGALPGGLSINSGTGGITGTLTTSGTFNFTVRVTDAEGFTADSAQSIAVAAGLSVSVNDAEALGYVFNPTNPPTEFVATFPETVATASGGTGPYTYAWTRISGSTQITADAPSAATTTFSGTIGAELVTATFRVTATDAAMATATADVSVSLEYANAL